MRIKKRPLPPVREEVTRKPWKVLCDSDWVVYILVASVGALTYANSLNGEFVHDDIPAIVSNRDVNGRNSVYKLFKNDFWGTPMSETTSHKSYRPLTTLSFRLNYLLCGLAPWWWHVCNVVLHAICCALVARSATVVARLRRPFAALAALLFAVHPIHTEAVSGIVGRADVLACVFFLSSVLLYHGSSSHQRVWSSVALAALSMLAKETGLTVVLFNAALDLYRCWGHIHKNSRSRSTSTVKWRWKYNSFYGRVLRVAAATVLVVLLRLALLQGSMPIFSPQDNLPAFHSSIIVRVMTFWYLAAFNWWLLLCPWSLSHDWQMGSVPLVLSAWDPRNLLTCAALLALLAISYRCLMDLGIQKPAPAVVGLLLLVVPYLPASNLLVTVGFVVAERVLYIPSVGSVILTAYGVQLVWRRASGRRLAVLSVAVLVATGAVRTHLRNRDWLNRETLLRADLAVLPHNAKLHYNFANFLKDIGQQEGAIKHYTEALNLWPSYASAHNNLGTLLLATAAEQAEQHFLQALNYNRNHVNAHFNLAQLYRKKKRIPEALILLERCITLGPHFILAYFELLILKPEKRKWILNQLQKLEPGNWEPFILYGNWMKERGLLPIAMQYYVLGMRAAFATGSTRGKLVTLRATSSALRTVGQQARILQLLTRWHAVRTDRPPPARREQAARAWRLRAELAARAARYDRSVKQPPVISTCIHHSQLEDSSVSTNHLKQPVNTDTTDIISSTANTDTTNITLSTTDTNSTNITLPTVNTNTTNITLPTTNTDTTKITLPTTDTNTTNITLPTTNTDTTKITLPTTDTNTTNITLPTTNTDTTKITLPTTDTNTTNITLPTTNTNTTNAPLLFANTNTTDLTFPTANTDNTNITLPTAKINTTDITLPTLKDANPTHADKGNKICCQKNYTNKSVYIPAQYKHNLNKSKSAQKQNSCPSLKKKVNDPETFSPILDHNIIKTY